MIPIKSFVFNLIHCLLASTTVLFPAFELLASVRPFEWVTESYNQVERRHVLSSTDYCSGVFRQN